MSKHFTLPPKVLSQHIGVLGKTGSGKTSTAKLIVESVVADGHRVCILDPIKSDWWGMTSDSSGKRPGLPFHILGGPHGHVPLHPAAGAAIGAVVASGALKLSIIDMADFDPGGPEKFFIAFAQALFKQVKGVVYLVIEEAHNFGPKERLGFGDQNLSIHWFKKLATASRSKGIRLIGCTHRTQDLHNAVLGSFETIIAHRTTLPADQKPIIDWLKGNTDKETTVTVGGELSSLPTGDGWMCSGEAKIVQRQHFPRISTYDNSATPDGSKAKEVKTAPVNTEHLASIVGSAIEEAKANDPRELKKEVAALKAQLAASASAKPVTVKPEIQRVDVPVVTDADLKRIELAASMIERAIERASVHLANTVGGVADPLKAILARVKAIKAGPDPIALARKAADFGAAVHVNVRGCKPMTLPAAKAIGRMAEAAKGTVAVDDGSLSKLERALLTVLAQRPNERIEKGKLLTLADYRWSGNVSDAFTKFINEGLAVGDRSAMQITESGIAVLGDFEPLPTGADLRQQILAKSSTLERALLEVLFSIYPDRISKGELLERAGYKWSGNVSDAFTKFLRVGWAVGSRSELAASPELFEK